jgi:hypothetical protein
LENGAKLDEEWKACIYKEAMERIGDERAKARYLRKRSQNY